MKDRTKFYISVENLDGRTLSSLTVGGCMFSQLPLNLRMSLNSLALVPGIVSRTNESNHNSITHQQRREDCNDLEKPKNRFECEAWFQSANNLEPINSETAMTSTTITPIIQFYEYDLIHN